MQCKFCKSDAIVKNGSRANSRSPNQRYQCSNCGRQFSGKKGKFSTSVMLRTVGLYNSGHSLAETAKLIRKEQKASVSQMTILRWARSSAPASSGFGTAWLRNTTTNCQP